MKHNAWLLALHWLMSQMTQGMKIAPNTTIIGLVGSMLLGIQYLMLDRSADKLVLDAVHASEVTHGAV